MMSIHNVTQYKNEVYPSKWKNQSLLTQKVILALLLLIGFQTTTSYAETEQIGDLSTIYHVYSDGEYLGGLSNETELESLELDKLNDAKQLYDQMNLTIGSELSVIPERVFEVAVDDDVVLKNIEDVLVVKADAMAMLIDGKPMLYVKDKETYDEVIRAIKLQSVTEEELQSYEASLISVEPLPLLQENETRIKHIVLSSVFKESEATVLPEEVLTVEEALVLLKKGTLVEETYTVVAGDVLGSIATANNMSSEALMKLNPSYDHSTTLHIGDKLLVTSPKPIVEVEVHYESKKTEEIPFEKIIEEDTNLYKGDKTVTQKGSDGQKLVTEYIRKKNGEVLGRSVEEEQVIVEARNEVTVVGTKEVPSRGVGLFKWPTDGGYISSKMGQRWGRLHRGIDIAGPSSRTITVADNGVVKAAGVEGSYGNRVVIDHNNGYETLYAHLSSIDVKVGQVVPQGTKIGVMGSTGHSTGIHLHFEVKRNGELINPMTVLK